MFSFFKTFIILPGDESRSPKQLQMDETVPNSEPIKQITTPFLDSCGDNAVDADDSKVKSTIIIIFIMLEIFLKLCIFNVILNSFQTVLLYDS